eukprot:scaffold13255_cov128-Isochrysis_galbana.AAC.2
MGQIKPRKQERTARRSIGCCACPGCACLPGARKDACLRCSTCRGTSSSRAMTPPHTRLCNKWASLRRSGRW